MIVVNFGGTSVGDAAALRRAAEIVKSKLDSDPIVVVSALGGATNALLAVGEQSAKGHLIGALRSVETLRDRHLRECDALLGESEESMEIAAELSAMFDELAHLAEALSTLGHVTPRSFDAIAAYGEQLSANLVSAYFRVAGIDAEYVDPRAVMITDDRFMEAEPQPELIAERSREILQPMVQQNAQRRH